MYHVLLSETIIEARRLMRVFESEDDLMIHVRWRGLPASEDTEEPLKTMYKDVPSLVQKLLERKLCI